MDIQSSNIQLSTLKEMPIRIFTRVVVDCVKQCNLRCHYCHPGEVWEEAVLPVNTISEIVQLATEFDILDITLTGGEITLHPQFEQLLSALSVADNLAIQMRTNGTLLTEKSVLNIVESNVNRVCISLDSHKPDIHDLYRGQTFERVIHGLKLLQNAGIEVTIISVIHKLNYPELEETADYLFDNNLASQYHIGAACFSGAAKDNYQNFKLELNDYQSIQNAVDRSMLKWRHNDKLITFNSYWPVTGRYGESQTRWVTSSQFIEQHKGRYVVIQPEGNVMPTVSSWEREAVGLKSAGNVKSETLSLILSRLENNFKDGNVNLQLKREVEAQHKFQYNTAEGSSEETLKLLEENTKLPKPEDFQGIPPIENSELLRIPLSGQDKKVLSECVRDSSCKYRLIRVGERTYLLFDLKRFLCLLVTIEELFSLLKKQEYTSKL